MGLFSRAKKALKKVKPSQALAVVAPYASVYTTSGRRALADTWGKVFTPIVSAVNPNAGAVLGTATSAFQTKKGEGGGGGGGGGGGYGFPAETQGAAGQVPVWAWVAAGGAVIVAAILYFRKH